MVTSYGAFHKSKELWMTMLQKVSPGSGAGLCPGSGRDPGPERSAPKPSLWGHRVTHLLTVNLT